MITELGYGDVELNGQTYRIVASSYKDKDLADFAPRAATPGGSIIHSELLLYQPLLQTDWRHGFGHVWYDDAQGYMTTEGQVDTRHKGIAMLFTKPTASDTYAWPKDGFISFSGDLYAWGTSGVRRYNGTTWTTVYTGSVNGMFKTNDFLFIFPTDDRIIRSASGDADEDGKAILITGLAGADNDILFQADTAGVAGNDITVTYTDTGASPPVASQTGDALNVNIDAGVTLASEVITAVNNLVASLVTATLRSGNDGTGVVPAMASTNLAGGSTTGTKAEYTTQQGVANCELKFLAVGEGTDGNDITITFALGASAAGSEVVSITDTDVVVTIHADSTAQNILNAILADVPQTASVRTSIDGDDNDILYTAVDAGNAGELITVVYTYTGAISDPGSETVNVSGSEITVNLHPNSKASHIIEAIKADAGASALVVPTTAPGDSGNGTVVPTGSETTWTNSVRLSNGAGSSVNNLLRVELASGNDGTGKPGAMTEKSLQGGSGKESWYDAGVNESSQDYLWAVFHAGKVFVGDASANRIHSASLAELDDLEGGDNDLNKIEVGDTDATLGGITYAQGLYITKPDGVWKYDEENLWATRILDYINEESVNNFRSIAIHNGFLVFPIQDKLYQWNAVRVSDITPDRLNDTFPFTTYGRFDNFVAVGNFLYMTARTNETSYTESLLCFDGTSWFKLNDLITGSDGTITAMGYDTDRKYLWYHHQTDAGDENTYYTPFQAISPFPYADFDTSTTHALITSRLDMGFRHVVKSIPSILVEGSNLLYDNQWIDVYFKGDEDDDWIYWRPIYQNGVTELVLPNNKRTVEYKYIQIKFVFNTVNADQSPILEGWVIRFLMRPDTFYGYNFDIVVANNAQMDYMDSDTRGPAEIVEDLREARNSKSPIRFVDIDGNIRYGYISSMSRRVVERQLIVEGGEQVVYEGLQNINFVEVRLDDGTT